MLYDGEKANFETMNRAFRNGDACILKCKDKKTGDHVTVVCGINRRGEEFELVPFAKLFNGNPYDEVEPLDDEWK